jgi:hypothetical protein
MPGWPSFGRTSKGSFPRYEERERGEERGEEREARGKDKEKG